MSRCSLTRWVEDNKIPYSPPAALSLYILPSYLTRGVADDIKPSSLVVLLLYSLHCYLTGWVADDQKPYSPVVLYLYMCPCSMQDGLQTTESFFF
jgi:hypothetical protein